MTLPAHIEIALREIGVVLAKAPPPPPPTRTGGVWYRSEDDIPF